MKIAVKKLGKRFNREWIFRNLSFDFEAGKTYAVVGANGSGKSTLLHILWGQLPASEGELRYYQDGSPIQPEDVFRYLAIATHNLDLIDEFTLREMIQFHFRFKKPRNGINTAEILQRMELDRAAEKRIADLSSGMRQRVKLALAFLSDAQMLFLDEPTTNLDAEGIQWYLNMKADLPPGMLIVIASNLAHEYAENDIKINISAYR